LAQDLPKLWKSPNASSQDRKRILRLLIKDITVEKRPLDHKAVLHLRWQGGAVEDLPLELPKSAPDKTRYPANIVDRVRSLAVSMTDQQIASALNQEGLLSAKGKPFTPSMITWIRYRHVIAPPSLKRTDEITVAEVVERMGVSLWVVYYWIKRGYLPARQIGEGYPYWISMTPEKENDLRCWVAGSKRIAPQPFQHSTVSEAL